MSGDRNASDLLSAFDPGNPAVLLTTARTVRLALGAVLAFQFLLPQLIPPVFVTWVIFPWVMGAPFAGLTRTSYVLGLVPWVLLAAMQVTHARLLRRAGGFPYGDAQVLWMTLVPGYNLYGTWCILRETGRSLEEAGAPAGTARALSWGTGAAIALGVAVAVELLYSSTASARPVTGTELFTLLFLLVAVRIYLLVRLHSAFSTEAVRDAVLEGERRPGSAASPVSARPPTNDAPPAGPSSRSPTPDLPRGGRAQAPGLPARALAVGTAIACLAAAGVIGFRAVRHPARWDEQIRRAEQGLDAPPRVNPPPPPRPADHRPAAAGMPPPPPPTHAAAGAEHAAVHHPDRLYGGRPLEWWQERIARLRASSGEAERAVADLTVERARANGLTVREEGSTVKVIAGEAAAIGSRGSRP